MKKIYTMLPAMLFCCLTTHAETVENHAETVENYVQDFEVKCSVSDKGYELPGSWGHLAEGYKGENATYHPTYTYKTGGGVDGSNCIQISNQAQVGSYNDSWGSSYDLLITPEVSGTITIDYKRQNSYSDGCFIEFYYLIPEDDTYTRGEMIEVAMPELSYQEFRTITFNIDTSQRIGIRASYGYIDHFTASRAEVEKKRALAIKTCTNITEGKASPVCNPDNKFKLKARVKIENVGEAEIAADDPDATISLCWADNYSGDGAIPLNTIPIGKVIPVGASVEVEIEAEVDANLYPDRAAYGVRDNISGTYEYMGWITPNVYKPKLELWRWDSTKVSDDAIKNKSFAIDFGRVNTSATKTYSIKNVGAAPMIVSSITAPEGVTVTPGDFTIGYNEEQAIEVTIDASQPGSVDSEIMINIEGIDPVGLNVRGSVLDNEEYWVSFEDGKFPSDMVVIGPQNSSRWSVKNCATSDKDKPVNNYWADNNSYNLSDHDRLVTPLLQFGEDDTISMDIFKKSSEENRNSQVIVFWSDDRNNWTQAARLTAEEMENPAGSSYSPKLIATPFAAAIPAGNHYVAIECNYVFIDDIYGGKKVEMANDLYPTLNKAPNLGMVNYECSASVDILNLRESESSAIVSLMVNEEEVATLPVGIGGLDKQTATLGFLADKELENAEAYFIIKAGDDEFKSTVWNLTIQPEVMISESEIIANETVSNTNVPFATNWYRTRSEIVYPASVLDLKEGDVINSLIFEGYRTNADPKTLKMKVWIENCDATAPDAGKPADVSAMTLVADEYPITLEAMGSSDAPRHKLIEVRFSEPFTYTGQSLRLVTHVLLDEYCGGTNFVVCRDKALINNAICTNDDEKTFDVDFTRSPSTKNAPVVIFGVEAEPVEITGIVSSVREDGATPLAGAVVTLKAVLPTDADPEVEALSDETADVRTVTYTATTDDTGFFTIRVLQPARNYNLTATAPDHFAYAHNEIIIPSEGDKEVNFGMEFDKLSAIRDVEYPTLKRSGIYNMQGIRLHDDIEALSPGMYIIDGKKTIIK